MLGQHTAQFSLWSRSMEVYILWWVKHIVTVRMSKEIKVILIHSSEKVFFRSNPKRFTWKYAIDISGFSLIWQSKLRWLPAYFHGLPFCDIFNSFATKWISEKKNRKRLTVSTALNLSFHKLLLAEIAIILNVNNSSIMLVVSFVSSFQTFSYCQTSVMNFLWTEWYYFFSWIKKSLQTIPNSIDSSVLLFLWKKIE